MQRDLKSIAIENMYSDKYSAFKVTYLNENGEEVGVTLTLGETGGLMIEHLGNHPDPLIISI